ncbi:hypothetical protein PAXRUDRAFT_168022, partial [Paxillus rubicundulus Ve08.2h10]
RSRGGGIFQMPESSATFIGEVPWSIFPGEVGEQNNDVRIIENEVAVDIGETKEGLDVFKLLRFQPIRDSYDFIGRYCQATGGKEVSKVFNRGGMEFTFFWFSIKSVLAEYFPDMLFMRMLFSKSMMQTLSIHIRNDDIDEVLEGCQSIGQTKQHYKPLQDTHRSHSGLLLVSRCDSDKMIGVPEVDLYIDFTLAWRVEEVRDE